MANPSLKKHKIKNIMEQNNQNDVEQPVDIAVEQQPVPAPTAVEDVPQAEVPVVPAKPQPRRKNGRNSRAGSNAQVKSKQNTQVCGEVSDISVESEKLSGSNVNGYPERKKAEEKSEELQNKTDEVKSAEEPKQESKECKCEAQKNHDGPAFEQKKFTPRAIEVPLEDLRPKSANSDKKQDGVVSYSAADEVACPPVSIFARIKSALKSIFGSKKKKNKDNKKKFDKNFKKDFKGKKNFHNKKFNKDGKYNNRRHQNRGKRQHNNASKEQ